MTSALSIPELSPPVHRDPPFRVRTTDDRPQDDGGAPDHAPALVCSGLTAQYRGRPKPTISDVSFELPRAGVVAVVGPSGSGKSTMCAAMLGEVEQVRGTVLLEGVNLLHSPGVTRRLVSFVPQRDALHDELTTRQALLLVAELRLAPALALADRERRVESVLHRLDLVAQARRRVGQLSGGQRKRVAVAMELLSEPRLLMLDEPTSGLDEGLDLQMMSLLRGIADEGRTVLVVTHSTANLGLADLVVAFDVHGRLAFVGPPQGLLASLGAGTYAEAMRALRIERAPEPARRRARSARVQPRRSLLARLRLPVPRRAATPRRRAAAPATTRSRTTTGPRTTTASQAPGVADRIRLRHAVRVLARREGLRLLATPRAMVRSMLLLPLLTCLLTAWAADRGLAGTPADPHMMQGAALSVLVTCTTFFAMATSFSTIVGEREVVGREYRWGVPPVAVVAAKLVVLLPVVVVQAVVTMSAYLLARPGPDTPMDIGGPWPMLTLSLALLGVSSMSLGLLVSASSRTLERAIVLLMSCVAVLVVLTGLLIPLGSPKGVGGHTLATLATVAPTRWGTASVSAYIGYVPNPAPGAPAGDTSLVDPLWTPDDAHLRQAWLAMAGLALLYAGAAARLLVVQSRRRR